MPGSSTPRDFRRSHRAYKRPQVSPSFEDEAHEASAIRPGRDPDTLLRSVQALTALGDQYFLPEALELLRRTNSKLYLSDDEILLLVVTAVQAARARHSELGDESAQATLQTIAHILDHEEVIRAEYNKLYNLFRTQAAAAPSAKERN
jgi:hypothetical protein